MSPARQPRAQLREQLIVEHLHLVDRIAHKVRAMFTHHIDIEDLRGCGRLGLVKAAAAYKPRKGKFEHFAFFYIRGAMIDANRRAAFREAGHLSMEGDRKQGERVDGRINHVVGAFAQRIPEARSAAPLPDELAARSQSARALEAAIAELPEDQRLVLVESLRGEDLADTAQACGRSLTWARGRLRMARDTVAASVRGKAA